MSRLPQQQLRGPTQIVAANTIGSLHNLLEGTHKFFRVLNVAYGADALPQGGRRRESGRATRTKLTAGLWGWLYFN